MLEEEGHEIEDNEILKFYFKENLMLLSDNEQWVSKSDSIISIFPSQLCNDNNINNTTNINDNTNNDNINNNTTKINDNTANINDNITNINDNTGTNLINDNNRIELLGNDTTEQLKSYVVPWHLLRNEILEFLNNGQRLPPHRFTEFVHFVSDDLRLITKNAKLQQIEEICIKISDKYPGSFSNCLSGSKLTDKPIQMIAKLQRRLNYLRSIETAPETTRKRKCQPANLVKTTCEEKVSAEFATAMQLHIQFLKKCSTHPKVKIQGEKIANAMAGTLILQKKFFHEKRTIAEVTESWPFLLEKVYFHKYFEFIMKTKLSDFSCNFILMAPLVSLKLTANKYSTIMDRTDMDDMMKTLEMIALYFDENASEIFDLFSVNIQKNLQRISYLKARLKN